MKPLSARDVAEELGRSLEWLYANWRNMVKDEGLPSPIGGGGKGTNLKWSTVQFYIWLDNDLPKDLRDRCTAFRAAITAINSSPATSEEAILIDQWTEKLQGRFPS